MNWLSKLQRIYQPASPVFWLMLMLNLLSFSLSWIVQNRVLNAFGMVLVGTFALVNAMLGMWLMWRLMQTKSPEKAIEK